MNVYVAVESGRGEPVREYTVLEKDGVRVVDRVSIIPFGRGHLDNQRPGGATRLAIERFKVVMSVWDQYVREAKSHEPYTKREQGSDELAQYMVGWLEYEGKGPSLKLGHTPIAVDEYVHQIRWSFARVCGVDNDTWTLFKAFYKPEEANDGNHKHE